MTDNKSKTPRFDKLTLSEFDDDKNRIILIEFANQLEEDLSAANARIAELEKENARLRGGLEFYSSEYNYKGRPCYVDRDLDSVDPPYIMEDEGEIARACLQEEKKDD